MVREVHETLKRIRLETNINKHDSVCLLPGSSGLALFNLLYIKHFKKNHITRSFQKDIQFLGENSFHLQDQSICSGQAGTSWFFSYLYNQNYLDKRDWSILCSENSKLVSDAYFYLKEDNYDFLHGALGIAYYLLFNPYFNEEGFFSKIIEELNRLMSINGEVIPHWDHKERKLDLNVINLGLAHGLPSALKYCIQSYKQGICKREASLLANQISQFLIGVIKNPSTLSYYPSCIVKNEIHTSSRLGWCYGDLSLGLILYQFGVCFDNSQVQIFALKILRETTKRKTDKETLVKDAGICHGSAGIAHIYNKMWHYTDDIIFKEACEFWIMDAVKRLNLPQYGNCYDKYNPMNNQYEKSTSLLEGSAGIGLVLVSYLTGDFSWDYCIMLN